jgi:hypothetical protein
VAFEALPDDLPSIPLLLREARTAFGGVIRAAIESAGMPALPANGPLIIRGLHEEVPIALLVGQRRKSLERFETLEKLRESGFLTGSEDDPQLSELGHGAAHVILDAVSALTTALNEYLGEDGMKDFVRGLLFLINEKEAREENQ